MCAPAPPSCHAHPTEPGLRTPPPPGQGLPLSEILQGPQSKYALQGATAREVSDGSKELLPSSSGA